MRSWSGPVHAQLEGPAMPVACLIATHVVALAGPGVEGGGGSVLVLVVACRWMLLSVAPAALSSARK
jgi:hypothetical protein